MTEQEAIKIIMQKTCGEEPVQHNCSDSCLYGEDKCAFAMAIAALEKQAEYKALEEQGLLLRLPLGVGDTFWELDQTWLAPHGYPRVAHSLQHVVYCMERLGKTTFLTEEAAKEAVAKLKGE